MIGGRRPLKGRKVADRRIRVERPHAPFFRYAGAGQLIAREAASRPRTGRGRALARLRGAVFGRPLSNEEEIGERLAKRKALAIFSSDAISSSAYATEEILRVLVLAGASVLLLSIQVAIAISVLLAVVSISYRQVCRAYPNGGGAYVVARTNLAPIFGLIAAAALLIDYVMTVAVSTAAAIAQIQSVIPQAYEVRIEIAFISNAQDATVALLDVATRSIVGRIDVNPARVKASGPGAPNYAQDSCWAALPTRHDSADAVPKNTKLHDEQTTAKYSRVGRSSLRS